MGSMSSRAGGLTLNAKIWLGVLAASGAIAVSISGTGVAAPAPAARPIKALSTLQPGQWEIRSRDNPQANRSFCMSDAKVLLQLQHPNNVCSRFVIADDGKQATVQYSCAAGGNGRTSIRVETPRLAQIETQGVADQMPFAFSAEARRTGECSTTPSGVASREKPKPRLGIR